MKVTVGANGHRITRRRDIDIREFPSVADCVVEFESDEYWEGHDAMNGGDDDN